MDSKSGRLPFSLSGSRSSYTTPSSYSASSSSLGSSRLYGRERLLSSDRFPRSSTTLKPEPDLKGSRYLGSSREYGGGGSSDSRAPSWKLPSSLSSAAYERPRANSTLCSHDKLTDPERRLGSYSGLLPSDDGDSKRAKLSYSSRAAYPRATTTTTTSSTTAGSLYPRATTTPSSTTAGSLYSSSRLTSSTDSGDKRTDSWSDASLRRSAGLSSSSSRPSSSSSSSSLWSSSPSFPSARRDAERRAELRSELTERRVRSSATSTASLYPTDRLTSSYAQGARPKETVYSSTTTSSVARESSLGRCHLPPPSSTSSSSSYQSQTSARSLRTSSGLRLPHQEARVFSSPPSPPSPHVSSTSAWHNIKSQYQNARGRRSDATPPSPSPSPPPPPPPAPPTPPSPTQRPAESDGRLSTRRLLFRLFSRRSGQESSSSSSSSSSSPPSSSSSSSSSPTVPRPRAASNTAAPPPSSSSSSSSVAGAGGAEPEPRVVDTVQAFAFLRRRRQDLTPIEETPRQASGGGGGGRGSSSSSSSWLTSSLRSRCPPLFSRHRRESPDEDVRLHTLRRPTVAPDPQHKSSDEEDDEDEDDEEEDEEEGAGASGATGPGGVIRVRPIRAVCRERGSAPSNAAVAVYRDILVGVDARYQAEGRGTETKPDPSRDPERLRKIQESLMLEDSDEEEGDLCRICQMGEDSAGTDPLIQPCRCTGSLQYVHQDCIKKWLRSKISSGTDLEAITTCELCKQKLHLNIDNFDVSELYRTHVQSECEFVSSGLYLVVLLHLCEQRFSDVLGAANEAGFFNLARSLHEHMDSLESPHGETEEEDDDDEEEVGLVSVHDSRPSIDFSDLEDELDEEY